MFSARPERARTLLALGIALVVAGCTGSGSSTPSPEHPPTGAASATAGQERPGASAAASSGGASPSTATESADTYLPAAFTRADLARLARTYRTDQERAYERAIGAPYDTRALARFYAGTALAATEFHSAYAKDGGDLSDERRFTMRIETGESRIFSLPQGAGDAAILYAPITHDRPTRTFTTPYVWLLVRPPGAEDWLITARTEVVKSYLPQPGPPRAPTPEMTARAREVVQDAIDYLETGVLPQDTLMGDLYGFRQNWEYVESINDGPEEVRVTPYDTGADGVGAGAPVTAIPTADGMLVGAQLQRVGTTAGTSSLGEPITLHGEGETDALYIQKRADGSRRTRDALEIVIHVPTDGQARVIAAGLALILPQR